MNLAKINKRVLSCLLSLVIAVGLLAGIPFQNALADAVAYNQYVSPWANYWYGGGTIAQTGCGILSTTNAINYMNGAFNTTAKADAFIQNWASYAHSIGGFNPGSSSSGGYRYILFGTDISNPPPLVQKYGSTYNFNMPITWTESWNSANYYNGSYYNNIYVNSQTSLKNYLAGNGVAIAHVPGHFICLASYNPNTDMFLVLDSAPTYARGTGNGVAWVSAYDLSGGRPALTVGGFCVLNSTAPVGPGYTYPFQVTSDTMMLYDGETKDNISANYNTTVELSASHSQGSNSLKMNYNNPTGNGSSIGGMVVASMSSAANLTGYSMIYVDVYFPKKLTGSHGLQINFATSGEDGYNAMKVVNDFAAGWHTLSIEMPALDQVVSSADWSKINKIRITWFNYSGLSGATYLLLDNIRAIKEDVPSIYPYDQSSTQAMLYDGESFGGLSTAFNTSLSLSGDKKEGSKSLKASFDNPAVNSGSVGGMVLQTLKSASDLSSYSYMVMEVYVSRNMSGSNGLQINFSAGSQDGFNYMHNITDWEAGWHTVKVVLSDIPVAKAENADWKKITTIRYTWFNYEGSSAATYFLFDNIRLIKETPPSYPYVVNNNSLMVYDGETTVGLTSHFNTSLTTNTGNITQGARSLKMTFEKPAADTNKIGGMVVQNLNTATDMRAYSHLEFDLYLSRTMTGSNGFQVNFSAGSQDGYNCMLNIGDYNAGWHKIQIALSDIPAAKPENADWSKIDTLRYTWFNYAGNNASTYILLDNVRVVKEVSHSYPYKVDDSTMMIYDGESIVGITTAYDTAVVTNGENTQGSRALKATFNNPAAQANGNKIGGMVFQSFNAATNLSAYTHLLVDVYFSRDMTGSNGLQINFGAGSQDGYNVMFGINNKKAGWHTFEVALADIPAAKPANADWTKTDTVRYTWFNYEGSANATYFLIDNVRVVDYTKAKAKQVVNMIEALPVSITLKEETAVITAREAYEALTEEEKAEVGNLALLESAEARILEIKAENKQKVETVSALIEALPQTVTLDHKQQINQAQTAYDELDSSLQGEISLELKEKLETAVAELAKILPFDMQFRGFETVKVDYSAERNDGDKLELKNDIPVEGKGYVTTTFVNGHDKLYQYFYGYDQNKQTDAAGVNADGCVALPVKEGTQYYITFDLYVSDASVFKTDGIWGDIGIDTTQKGGSSQWGNTFHVSKEIFTPVLSQLKNGWNHIALPIAFKEQAFASEFAGTTLTLESIRIRVPYVTLPAGFVCGLDDVRFMDETAVDTVFAGRTNAKQITTAIRAFTPNSSFEEFYAIYRNYNKLDEEYRSVIIGWDAFVKTYLQFAQEAQQQLYVDKESAKTVNDLIAALPASEQLTSQHRTDIDGILEIYEGLSDVAKSFVTNWEIFLSAKDTVERAEVTALIDALPNPVGLLDESLVVTAREALESLTQQQQKQIENVAKLQLAEQQLEEAKNNATAEELDKAVAKTVEEQINALPEKITVENAFLLEQARKAYEGLTQTQKGYVSNLHKLEQAEENWRILQADLDAAEEVILLISTISFPITRESDAEIEETRAAYENLTEIQKEYVTNLAVLEQAEQALETIKQDIVVAEQMEKVIDALPATVTLGDEIQIVKAREQYDALSSSQKEYVTNLAVLEQAEAALALVKETATQEELDKAVAALMDYQIEKLVQPVTLEQEQQVVSLRATFEGLTKEQQKLVTKLELLEQAETAIALLKEQRQQDEEAAKAVDELIMALPAPSDITVAHKDTVESVRKAYEGLTLAQKQLVEYLLILENAEIALEKAIQNQPPAVLLGDVNGDQKVDAKDALLVLKASVGKEKLASQQEAAAEVDGKEGINAKDALEILKYTVGKINKFLIEN